MRTFETIFQLVFLAIMIMKKILIIRFSSIGDIVLTSPIPKILGENIENAEIHFLTKKGFAPLIAYNPFISKVHTFDNDKLDEVIESLKKENFDFILDLHNNLRTLRIKWALRKASATFDKRSIARFLYTKLRMRNIKIANVTDRYIAAATKCLAHFGYTERIESPQLAFYFPQDLSPTLSGDFDFSSAYAIVLGATYETKKWLPAYFATLIESLQRPVVFIGGKEEQESLSFITQQISVPYFDAVGKFSLLEASYIMGKTQFVIAHDTGFMHIAAALGMKIFSLWGSTSPQLGFAPYKADNTSLEVTNLACHPCSKMGTKTCPKGHFKCMKELYPETVMAAIQTHIAISHL